MSEMEAKLQRLIDRQEITDQLLDYGRAMDRLDIELGKNVFHPDAPADYGAGIFQGTCHGFVEQMCDVVHPMFKTHSHQFSNIRIWFDGDDRARSETHVDMAGRIPDGQGGWNDLRSLGRYLDHWEKREGTWRIAHRSFALDFDRVQPSAPMSEPTGRRDRSDPSYFGQ